MARKAYTFRLSDETNEQLEFLCDKLGENRTDTITAMIAAEYDKWHGNPALLEMASQMKALSEQMKSYLGKSKEQ